MKDIFQPRRLEEREEKLKRLRIEEEKRTKERVIKSADIEEEVITYQGDIITVGKPYPYDVSSTGLNHFMREVFINNEFAGLATSYEPDFGICNNGLTYEEIIRCFQESKASRKRYKYGKPIAKEVKKEFEAYRCRILREENKLGQGDS